MISLTFGLFTQVSDSGPQGPLVSLYSKEIFNKQDLVQSGSKVMKIVMLNSAEHEILNAYKNKNIEKCGCYQVRLDINC